MAVASPSMQERFQRIATGHVADALEHLGVRTPMLRGGFRPLTNTTRMAGPAVTLEVCRSRFGTESRRLTEFLDETVDQGTVLVIDAQRINDTVLFGDRAGLRARMRGAVGAVINGYVRDIDGLETLEFPVHALGAGIPASEGKLQGVRLNEDLVVNGILVQPGDWMVADPTGVCVVPRGIVSEVLELAEERDATDKESLVELRAGKTARDTHRHFKSDNADSIRSLE